MLKVAQSIILLIMLLFGSCEIFSKGRTTSLKKEKSIKKKKSSKRRKKKKARARKGKKGKKGVPSYKREAKSPTRLPQLSPSVPVQPVAGIAAQRAAEIEREKEVEKKKVIEREKKEREEKERLQKEWQEKLKQERLQEEENFKKIGDVIENMLNIEKAYISSKDLIHTTLAGAYSGEFASKKVQLWNEIKDLYDKSNFPERAKEFLDSLGQFIKKAQSELASELFAVEIEKIEKGSVCAVCLEELQDPSLKEEYGEIVQLKCNKHQFHRECIEEWLNLKAECPICKIQIIYLFIPDMQSLENFINLLEQSGWESNAMSAKNRLAEFLRSEEMMKIFNENSKAGTYQMKAEELIRYTLGRVFP